MLWENVKESVEMFMNGKGVLTIAHTRDPETEIQ